MGRAVIEGLWLRYQGMLVEEDVGRECSRTPSPCPQPWSALAGGQLAHWLAHSLAQEGGGCHQLSHCQAPSAASGGCGSTQGALPLPPNWSRLSADLLWFLLCFPGSPAPSPPRVPSD